MQAIKAGIRQQIFVRWQAKKLKMIQKKKKTLRFTRKSFSIFR